MRCPLFKILLGFLGVLLFISPTSRLHGQTSETAKSRWVDSVYKSLSDDARIGQLIMIASPSTRDRREYEKVIRSIKKNKVGGICFFKGFTENLCFLSQLYQSTSDVPLWYAIDGEWGLGMRLNDGFSFPKQMLLGATHNEGFLYLMGAFIAMQAQQQGIHINFAPCVDLNNNPQNPVINMRSFGENKHQVARLSLAYAQGMQDGGLIAVAKHFPGHGDTDVDSHKDLPIIHHSKPFIDSIDTYPFRHLIKHGVKGIMVGHLQVPALMKTDSISSSVSQEVIGQYLVDSLGFQGLIFTDALNMQGITKHLPQGESEVQALLAGVDVLLMPMDESVTIDAVKQAIAEARLPWEVIEQKCKKVLSYKYDLGLHKKPATPSIPPKQEYRLAEQLSLKIANDAITLLKNKNQLLPLQNPAYLKIALVDINRSVSEGAFRQYFPSEWNIRYFDVSDYKSVADLRELGKTLDSMDIIIGNVYGSSVAGISSNYGVSRLTLDKSAFLASLRSEFIASIFANPYLLSQIELIKGIDVLLCAYQDMSVTQQAMASKLSNDSDTKGKLPVSVSPTLVEGFGLSVYDEESEQNFAPVVHSREYFRKLQSIDSIAQTGIKKGAYPGCQILILHHGKPIYNKSFGTRSVSDRTPVTEHTIYDLASCTKVLATTLAMMKLYEDGKIDINDPLSYYLPYLKGTNKETLTIKEVMSHVARLKSWIPFWKKTITDHQFDTSLYAFHIPQEDTSYVQVCDNLYIKKTYKQTIYKTIADSKLNRSHKYEYSDLGFILLSDLVLRVSGMELDRFVSEHFYKPMHLEHLAFSPMSTFSKADIAPTENDITFRKKLIHGFVHDQAAALLGGVSGHAGLFGNAHDVAEICRMLSDRGMYKGRKYLSSSTIETFNTRYYADNNVRRGLGFDKPMIEGKVVNCSPLAHENSFGHSGFTGTFFWADPDNDLIYVFLSNRINPKTEPNLLVKSGIRTNIQTLIYEALAADRKNEKNK